MSREIASLLADALGELLQENSELMQRIAASARSHERSHAASDPQADGAEPLLAQLDAVKPRCLPLPPHTVADMDGHTRGAYGRLLAAVAMARPLTGGNSRLLQMVLTSIGDAPPASCLYGGALLDANSITECVSSLRAAKLEPTFLLDALVLSRIDGPLTPAQQALLDEVADVLGIEAHTAEEVANLAAVVLGLPAEQLPSPRDFDYSRFRVWDEFLWQPLPEEIPEAGISGGRWDVSGPTNIIRPWIACNADFRFLDDAYICTDSGGVVSLSGCHFFKARLKFLGNHVLKLSNCHFYGSYQNENLITAIDIRDINSAEISNCHFCTESARSIMATNCQLKLDTCTFEHCGNHRLHGGALLIRMNTRADLTNHFTHNQNGGITSIDHCIFEACEASVGGAIRIDSLPFKCISDSTFKDCRSLSIEASPSLYSGPSCLLGGAIFCGTSDSRGTAVSDSRFENCGVFLGAIYPGDWLEILRGCSFKFSGVSKMPDSIDRSNCRDCSWTNEQGDARLERIIPAIYEPWWNTIQ